MKKIFNLHNISLVLVVAIVSIFSIVKVNAAITWDNNKNSVTISRDVTGINNPITNTFTYTVTADGSNPTGASNIPSGGTVVFDGSETPTSNTVTETGTIDFSSATFTHPGVYKYTITETASSNSTYPVDNTEYTVEITVQNTNTASPDGENFTAYLFLKDSSEQKVAQAEYTSAADQSDFAHVVLNKHVTGGDADVTDYFPYTVSLYAAGTYTINGLTAGVSCGGSTQAATATLSGGSTSTPSTATICLKHGDSVTIGYENSLNTIPTGTRIDIVETPGTYTPSYTVNGGSSVSSASLSNHTLTNGTTTVAYTNNKASTVPTGVILTIIPYVLLVIVSVGGTVLYMNMKDKKPSKK